MLNDSDCFYFMHKIKCVHSNKTTNRINNLNIQILNINKHLQPLFHYSAVKILPERTWEQEFKKTDVVKKL